MSKYSNDTDVKRVKMVEYLNREVDDEKLRLAVELKIETLSNGDVQVTWLNGGKVTLEYIDNEVTISKTVINDDADKSRTIPKGNYTFNDIDFLYELLDKVRSQFSSSELDVIKNFFTDGNTYSYKINLGEYVVLDDFDGTSNIIAGTFGIADSPSNSVYTYYQRFNEGQSVDICFETPWAAEEDITFNIDPIYEDKPGFIKQSEANFSSTSVTIPKGSSSECVTFISPLDTAYKEKQELIDFLYSMTIGENDLKIYELEDNFDMYISIAKYANNALPIHIIQNDIFRKYRIKKKHFPKRFSYHL